MTANYHIFTIDMAPGDPDDIDNDLLHPVASDEPDSLLREPADGDDVRRLFCNAASIRIPDKKKPVLEMEKIRMAVEITDCRIAFACTKYEKGGGWIGGPTALALNAGSKMLAARRRRGKILIGHIRYPWVAAVWAEARHGFGGTETLRVVVMVDDEVLTLQVEFPKEVSATAIATELIRRVAAFRLAHMADELNDEQREAFEAAADLAPLVHEKGSKAMVGMRLPTFDQVSEHSARHGRQVA